MPTVSRLMAMARREKPAGLTALRESRPSGTAMGGGGSGEVSWGGLERALGEGLGAGLGATHSTMLGCLHSDCMPISLASSARSLMLPILRATLRPFRESMAEYTMPLAPIAKRGEAEGSG